MMMMKVLCFFILHTDASADAQKMYCTYGNDRLIVLIVFSTIHGKIPRKELLVNSAGSAVHGDLVGPTLQKK